MDLAFQTFEILRVQTQLSLVVELDELETFIGSKKTCVWLWIAVDHFKADILAWAVGDHDAQTFKH